mmetsp:Transcript_4672/g.6477  ORF Transcript_4672/g.6477 Transcript_4672/m.6477 type:complete len:91 (+) Transcript_4672:130-402(+)
MILHIFQQLANSTIHTGLRSMGTLAPDLSQVGISTLVTDTLLATLTRLIPAMSSLPSARVQSTQVSCHTAQAFGHLVGRILGMIKYVGGI